MFFYDGVVCSGKKEKFMHKKIWFFLLFCLSVYSKPLSVNIFAKSAVLINADSKKVLFEKKANAPFYPASTTKVATVLYLLEKKNDLFGKAIKASYDALAIVDPKEKVEKNYSFPAYWLETDGTTYGIRLGEILSFEALIYGAMIPSGNDASNVLAEAASGSIPLFVKELNSYAQQLGCKNTHFCNPHGLHHPEHVTTPYDMALITAQALKFPFFRKVVKTKCFIRPKTNAQKKREYFQYNRLLKEGKYYYPYAIGVKSGYHSNSKYNLVAAAEKDSRTLIAVLFGGEDPTYRYIDAKKLFEEAFSEEKQQKKIFSRERIFSAQVEGARRPILASFKEDCIIAYFPSEEPEVIKAQIHWTNVSLPIKKDQVVGEVVIKDENDAKIKTLPLYAKESVSKTLVYGIKMFFKNLF